jgi:hypothetical protein
MRLDRKSTAALICPSGNHVVRLTLLHPPHTARVCDDRDTSAFVY